eukprot:1140244-Amphidinium_carterae.1
MADDSALLLAVILVRYHPLVAVDLGVHGASACLEWSYLLIDGTCYLNATKRARRLWREHARRHTLTLPAASLAAPLDITLGKA